MMISIWIKHKTAIPELLHSTQSLVVSAFLGGEVCC